MSSFSYSVYKAGACSDDESQMLTKDDGGERREQSQPHTLSLLSLETQGFHSGEGKIRCTKCNGHLLLIGTIRIRFISFTTPIILIFLHNNGKQVPRQQQTPLRMLWPPDKESQNWMSILQAQIGLGKGPLGSQDNILQRQDQFRGAIRRDTSEWLERTLRNVLTLNFYQEIQFKFERSYSIQGVMYM